VRYFEGLNQEGCFSGGLGFWVDWVLSGLRVLTERFIKMEMRSKALNLIQET
jgi:hypothetical protein